MLEILKVLNDVGFTGFKLKENKEEKGTYSIIRHNGDRVQKTLSEGERNFISFLYFYYLIYGSHNISDINSSKIIIIDDPVSSMDSNVLYIVSTLVKNILKNCKGDMQNIKQLFVFTHNAYFHKEVSFRAGGKTQVKYWIIRKIDNISQIIPSVENPIRTSYELLWSEIKEGMQNPKISILNPIRRILEYYFCLMGSEDYKEYILSKISDEEDKTTCISLLSGINDGSHGVYDEIYTYVDEEDIRKYLEAFKLIFEKTDHESHYRMMMGIVDSETNQTTV